jgi:acetyl-CoA carboxylase biotin carboxyl carrier protein
MTLKEIKEIIALMNENDLSEIEVEREGVKLKIKKALGGSVVVEHPARPSVMYHPEPAVPPASAPIQVAPAAAAPASNRKLITSPMVGTFYRAPSPDAPPFVDAGQTVEVGQVVCIVEAMKLMNEIKAEVRGKIVEIPVQNAEPVEFGQTLFVVEPL